MAAEAAVKVAKAVLVATVEVVGVIQASVGILINPVITTEVVVALAVAVELEAEETDIIMTSVTTIG